MDTDVKREAGKQYLRYFRFWFAGVLILLVIFLITTVTEGMPKGKRQNGQAPAERVYDYAEVLTEQEEEALRELIARSESRIQSDIVLVTIRQEVGADDYTWESTMMNLADDFYDENNYGYDRVHGNGVLLLDNWYEGQAGSWLSTCGSVYERFGTAEVNGVLDAVSARVEKSPYQGYKAYVEQVVSRMTGRIRPTDMRIVWAVVFLLPVIAASIFIGMKLHNPAGRNEVTARTYVAGGKPVMKNAQDIFIRKLVTKRRIPKPDGGSGGRSGGGGGHVSSGGVRHGGGGSRR